MVVVDWSIGAKKGYFQSARFQRLIKLQMPIYTNSKSFGLHAYETRSTAEGKLIFQRSKYRQCCLRKLLGRKI